MTTIARRNLIILSISGSIVLFLILELARSSAYRCENLLSGGAGSSVHPRQIDEQTNESFAAPRRTATSVMKNASSDVNHGGLSILGEWLHAPEGTPPPPVSRRQRYHRGNDKRLLILVWKYGPFLERRHIRHSVTSSVKYRETPPSSSSSSSSSSWMEGCSATHCQLTYQEDDLARADAVIFHLHLTKGIDELPSTESKPTGQIWIFMTDESPLHTFMYDENGNRDISVYDGIFDWSMTYREDSDVPVAYGRTILKKKEQQIGQGRGRRRRRRLERNDAAAAAADEGILLGKKKKLVAIMGSNCSSRDNQRWKYVRELKMLLGKRLDIYGKCLGGNRTACPGHFHNDCPILFEYKFYLAFENSNCREYITEKVYWNAYEKRSVPIIMGAPRKDCEKLLPPRSFIHVDDFANPSNLVDYIRYLDDNDDSYGEYHKWRLRYRVINEHGYFGSKSRHYCRVCEALHYNLLPSFGQAGKYREIGRYWNSSRDCYPPIEHIRTSFTYHV